MDEILADYNEAELELLAGFLQKVTAAGIIAGALSESGGRSLLVRCQSLLETTRKDVFDFQKPYAHKHAPTRQASRITDKRIHARGEPQLR